MIIDNKEKLCLENFMNLVNNELTYGCSIPISIPQQQMIQIIGNAKKWFYKNYEDSLKECYFFLNKQNWQDIEYRDHAHVVLPNYVFSVHGVHELDREQFNNNRALWVHLNSDLNMKRLLYSDIASYSESLLYYVASESFADMTRQLFVNKVSYNYNRLTHTLQFMGEKPDDHIALLIFKTIDDCALFQDEIFLRWVVAQCKIQLGNILGYFQYNYPGNIQINFDAIKSDGTEAISEIKEEIKGEEGCSYFLTS